MNIKKTEQGFKIIEFKDRYGTECSLQESSLADENTIWFGTTDANPVVLEYGKGWQAVPFPDNTLFHTRMHLTQKQIKELLPYLDYFAQYGILPDENFNVKH